MQTIPTGVPTFVDELQTLCLCKSSVRTDCVATPSEALFGQYCTAQEVVYYYHNGEKKTINKGRQTNHYNP